MKKITVITLQNVRNYGSALQALATQEVLHSVGGEVDFFNYMRANIATPAARIKEWTKGMGAVKKMLYASLLYPTFKLQDIRFSRFLHTYLNVQPTVCKNIDDFRKLKLSSDIYCTGSDQTWNSGWNGGILPELFLEFVPDSIRKIAYSASFGKSELADWEKEETKRLIGRYHAVSVRESSAVDIISGLGIDGAVHVLDPTLQVDRNFWMKYAGVKKIKERYVLIYQLNTNPEFDAYAKEYAKRRGAKLVRFCTRLDQVIKCGKAQIVPDVLDFVNMIAYADTVITDSFHATAFSINMNTNFISIYPEEYSSRLSSILQLTGLQERHLTDYGDFSFVVNTLTDFSNANAVLDRQRRIGQDFFKRAING